MKLTIYFLTFLLVCSLVTAIDVTQVEVVELKDNSFVVKWTTDEPTTSQVFYGTSGRLGDISQINTVLSFNHQLQVENLEPGTMYFFRASGTNSQGERYFSAISVTRTTNTNQNPPDNPTDTSFGISGFYITKEDDNSIRELQNGDTIYIDDYGNDVSIAARTYGSPIGSVIFFSNTKYQNTEQGAPYTVYPPLAEWTTYGTQTFTARVYDDVCPYFTQDCSALQGESQSITLTIQQTNPSDSSDKPPATPPPQPPPPTPPPSNPPPSASAQGNSLFTASAKSILQQRLRDGYRTSSRHEDDFANMKTEVAAFNQNPIESRLTEYFPLVNQRIPEFGRRPNSAYDGINTDIYRTGPGAPQFKPMERPFLAAIYAYLTDDVETANNVMEELIWLANNDDVDPSNGRSKVNNKHGTFERWPQDVWLTNPPFFTMFSYVGKWMEAYELVKDLETVSSASDRARIQQWFKDFEVYGREESEYFMGLFMGNDWRNGNPRVTADAGEFSFSGTSRPIQDRNGNPDNRFIISNAQNRYNNRQTGIIDYIHAYGITFNDAEAKDFGEDYFRQYFKFMIFPDGTNAEMFRSNADLPERGVVYHWVTATHLTKMAHRHAVAVENGLPSVAGESAGKLFDYTTTDGFIQGSTRYGSSYGGSSTTDGSTPKGLGMYVRTIPNYYRSSHYGGWTDVRYNSGRSIDGGRILKYTAPGAFVNLWYDDQELKEYYRMDTSQGYPTYSPDYIGEWGRDVGPWGTLYGVGLWSDMEHSFFS